MAPIPRGMRVLMAVVVGVSIPEGLALLFGPKDWYTVIWGWALTEMTAKFTAGLYLSVAVGFIMAWRETEWEKTRIPLAMLWFFALIALLSVMYVIATTAAEPIVHLERPFTWVWFGLYTVSVIGGLYYHMIYPRSFGEKAF